MRTIQKRGRIICLVACLLAAASAVATAGEAWTPRHVSKLRSVTSAVIAPDAAHIAYVLSIPRDPFKAGDDKYEDGANWAELHVIRIADGAARPFITGEVNVNDAQWTPDSKHITFLAKRPKDKNTSLYKIAVDGGEAQRIASAKTDLDGYTLSPDGNRVAFLAKEETPKAKKDAKDKGFTAEVYEEELQNTRVWIAELAKDDAPPRMIDLPGSASPIRWSPAGDQLLVALSPTPLVDDEYMKRKVHVVDVETGKVLLMFDNPGKLGPLAWSPDGKHIAIMSAEDIHDPSDGRLMVGSVATGKLTDVLPKYEGAVSAFGWQDNNTVMFLGDEGCATGFGKVEVTGANKKIIVKPGVTSLTDFTLSRDGMSGAFIGSTASHPPELFFMKHGDAAPRKLTDSNPWLAGMNMGKQEIIRYKARDGVELEGILIRPADETPRMMFPLILCVHGGPESHERDGWLTNYWRPGQLGASAGYFTFYPNYRGSTGRGVPFSKLSQGDEAGAEFDDLIDAAKFLCETYPIDKSKVGVTGGSYGGYATAWCCTALTEHFAAGVMSVGISDTISKKATTDIPNEDFLVHTRMKIWEDEKNWLFSLKRSPIFHVAKAKTPILIMGGKNDTRVHPSQSLELYRFLKTVGQTPVRLVQFPGEGHGNRKAALKLDYTIRMMQWFDHYLKGPGGAPPPAEIDVGLNDSAKKDGDEKKDDTK